MLEAALPPEGGFTVDETAGTRVCSAYFTIALHQPCEIAERTIDEFLAAGVLSLIRRNIQTQEILCFRGRSRPCLRRLSHKLSFEFFLSAAQVFLVRLEVLQRMSSDICRHPPGHAPAAVGIDRIDRVDL